MIKLTTIAIIGTIIGLDIIKLLIRNREKTAIRGFAAYKSVRYFLSALNFIGVLLLFAQHLWYGIAGKMVLEVLLWISVALVVFSVYIFIKHIIIKEKPLFTKILNYAMFFGAIWCLRYAVGYYGVILEQSDGLSWWDEIFNSIIHTLQTMSLDEDYTFYIATGKDMMVWLGHPELATAYGLYASSLNMLAPIVGGLVIFEVIANIFTNVKLWFLNFDILRHKYYFSELNERSLALAKSIRESYSGMLAPLCIFADTYSDAGNEFMSELISEAKNMDFICVKEDISHIKKPLLGKKTYFIIDENEAFNLHTLADITSGNNKKFSLSRFVGVPILASEVKIYVFSTEDISAYKIQAVKALTTLETEDYSGLSEKTAEKMRARQKKRQDKIDKACPIITVVNSYRNLIANLFVEVPLYEPIVGSGKKELNVTVLGGGLIGTEAVIEAYWMGQMLGCSLNINVMSQEDDKTFYDKIDYVNPEIRMTMDEGNDILVYHRESGKKGVPYATLKYVQTDVKNSILGGLDEDKDKAEIIAKTDYFIVSLGTDMDNLSVAEKLRSRIGNEMANGGSERKTVIAYAVYDSDLCDVLNSRAKDRGIYMYAFGARRKVYSCENIFMTEHTLLASSAKKGYAKIKVQAPAVMQKDDSDYTLWANLARALHTKYKAFSLGWIKHSVVDTPAPEHKKHMAIVLGRYIRLCACGYKNDDSEYGRELNEKSVRLACLEHRRWNSFCRVMGYRALNNCDANGGHKVPSFKLHGCIKECSPEFDNPLGFYDGLDVLSREKYYAMNGKEASENDPCKLKEYDYPQYQFGEYVTLESASETLGVSQKKLKELCLKDKISGVISYTDEAGEGSYLLPVSYVKNAKDNK